MRILQPEDDEDYARYYDLRWRILRQPWGQPPGSERDALEEQSWHRMACIQARIPIGVARLHLISPEQAQIRYMAVEAASRRNGAGSALAAELEQLAQTLGATEVMLYARNENRDFYAHLGYEIIAPAHTLFGTIAHTEMRKQLHR